jgi:hypothetical protein
MAEIKVDVKVVEVDMVCDGCNEGKMRSNGIVYSTYPEQYPHVCTKCSRSMTYQVRYPYIAYEKVQQPTTGEQNG